MVDASIRKVLASVAVGDDSPSDDGPRLRHRSFKREPRRGAGVRRVLGFTMAE